MALASFILGIVGLVLSISIFTYPVSLISGILAILFGIVGYIGRKEESKKAIAGIIMGIFTLIISAVVSIGIYNLVQFVIENYPKMMEEILQFFDNEKEMLLDDIVNKIKELLP